MINSSFVGREKEIAVLKNAIQSNEAELVAILGRRRVGKTFLVRTVYENRIEFEVTGLRNANLKEQLQHFTNRLHIHARPNVPYQTPASWLEAFHLLTLYLLNKKFEEKIVLFFDEFPWIATRKSGFVRAFGSFWNSWAAKNNVVVVICGSAASWMIQKVVRDRGGLHNRITKRIHLSPFNLAETYTFLKSRWENIDYYNLVQIYMTTGGIPHYLKEVKGGKSAAQNIEQMFFSRSGFLHEEFNQLYPALFENADLHIKIIRLLAATWQGLTRKEIIERGKFSDGGSISKVLEELIQSDFIKPFYQFGKKKKGMYYRLMDEYSIFYLKFIEDQRLEEAGMWKKFSQTQTYKIWTGYAFENICLRHIPQIKRALGISGIYAETSTYRSRANEEVEGTQIDFLIDRNDHLINLFEVKFHNTDFILTRDYASKLRKKMGVFQHNTGTRKLCSWVLLTTFGLAANKHSTGLVDHVITMEAL
ncbi:MAG: ATP-binding protein, partial [Bacteroidota bacterium]